ncbi:hypothetical protein CAPTEDRAFT_215572 [Capitella teleta]|uniref:Uncharacterized protein n=1 Tax=Capitella teleta TaxID=283909 RepID=R7U9X5_CAPTE|nr:hypothetical protein CAPTEDRAFT_215572 [Capitella teleta]|eukprot:ELU02789.1 hypothetical protein CAPTEDRAFT_215572 [Capitella teleta]
MAQASVLTALPPYHPLDLSDSSNIKERRDRWKKGFNNLMTALAVQESQETVDQFHMRLRQKDCEFANADKEIKTQIIQGCRSSRLQRKILQETGKSLDDILKLVWSKELLKTQANTMKQSGSSVGKASPKEESTENQVRSQDTFKKKHHTSKKIESIRPQSPSLKISLRGFTVFSLDFNRNAHGNLDFCMKRTTLR